MDSDPRPGPQSIERMVQDGIDVAKFLRGHLHKEKMILLGHSWGSILGIHMARRRPEQPLDTFRRALPPQHFRHLSERNAG